MLKDKKLLLIVAAVVVVSAVVWAFVGPDKKDQAPPTQNPPTNEVITVEGEAVCLPHKNTEGPQTLECASGIKLDDGTYYALSYPQENHLPFNKRTRFTGTLKADSSETYQSTGLFTATKTEVIE